MPRTPATGSRRALAGLLLLAVVVGQPWKLCLISAGTSDKKNDGTGAETDDKLGKFGGVLINPLRLRHSVAAENSRFAFHGIAQGEDQWSLTVGKDFATPLAVVSKLNGGPATYAISYDSSKTSFKPKYVKRVFFSAAGVEGADPVDADWSLRAEGQDGKHFSMTMDEGEVVYEGTYTHAQPLGEGLEALYVVDAKKRATGDKNLAPGFLRHGLGLRYGSPIGDFKVNIHQSNPDLEEGKLEFEALYKGDAAGPPGSPAYRVRALRTENEKVGYEGLVKFKGPTGAAGTVMGGLHFDVKDGKTQVGGFTDLSTSRKLYTGVELLADTRVVASPTGTDLQPIALTAKADLQALAPDYMTDDSGVTLTARYKLGEEKPQLAASTILKPKPIGPLKFSAAGFVQTDGDNAGRLSASATVANVDATYEAKKVLGTSSAQHVGQVVWPAYAAKDHDKDGVRPRVYGRVTQSSMDYGGKPRLQIGTMYDFSARGTKFAGQSSVYDMGDELVDENGVPWPNVMFNRAQNNARILRKRIQLSSSEGQQWLSRP